MKREESLLNLLCVVAAAGFFALIAYDLVAGGSIISTDGLFFIVVPLVFALAFLAVPGMGFLQRRLEKRAGSGSGSPTPQLAWRQAGYSGLERRQRTSYTSGCKSNGLANERGQEKRITSRNYSFILPPVWKN